MSVRVGSGGEVLGVPLRSVAWGALWFLVVVVFTAGVGVIQAAGQDGEMPPLTSTVQSVMHNDDPSSVPAPR